MSISLPHDPRDLTDAVKSALDALASQRARLDELRALSLGDGRRLRLIAKPTGDEISTACIETLYSRTIDFTVAELSDVIDRLERALDAAAGPDVADVRVHLRIVDL